LLGTLCSNGAATRSGNGENLTCLLARKTSSS